MIQFIRDIHAAKNAAGQAVISFEVFPPKTDEGDKNLFERHIPELMKLRPDFCSVTYGAGGSTREKTISIVDRIQREHGLTAMMHLTCVNATKAELTAVLTEARARGIKNILALRGDPPGGGEFQPTPGVTAVLTEARARGIKNILALRGDPPGGGEFQPTPGGFEFSYRLVEHLRELGGFSIGTAGFPEGHIACKEGKRVDWDRLKAKIDSGADFVVTQLFFDNADFYAFRDYLTTRGVTVPLVPGILPAMSGSQVKRFTALCGAQLPAPFLAGLEKCGADDAAATEFGIEYASAQCADLLKNGAEGIHFYTLNKAHSTTRILKNLRLA